MRNDAARKELIDRFNEKFPVGSKVYWRNVGKDSEPYEIVTVKSDAWDQHGMEVVFFEEKSGFCSIGPGHVDYRSVPPPVGEASVQDAPSSDKEETPPLYNTNSNEFIEVVNIVSGRTMEPLVEIRLGIERAQLTVTDARQHAQYILEVAEAAESDAFVFQWLHRDIIGDDKDNKENWEKLIAEFQAFRDARRSNRGK